MSSSCASGHGSSGLRCTRLILLAALLLVAAACRGRRGEKSTAEFFAMGGIPIHVTVWDVAEDEFARLVDEYRREVQRLESLMSKHRKESFLSRLNDANGAELLADPDTAQVLRRAIELSEMTVGAFDPTVGPILDLWKEAETLGVPPAPGRLADVVQAVVGVRHIHLGRDGPNGTPVRLDPGTRLDLGAIAKGYFADVGVRLLRRHGVRRALVELGGDLVAYDDRSRPEPFRIGVRDPANPDGLLGVLDVPGGGIVTSGDYARGYEVGGERFNHIIDPRVGRPAQGVHSVTLAASDGTTADALATGVLVDGPELGLASVERLAGVEAVLVVDDPDDPGRRKVLVSSGWRDRFVPAGDDAPPTP